MSFPVTPTPQPTDIPSQTQGVLLTNFNNLIGWAAVDHVGYGVSTVAGQHNQVTLPVNSSVVAPTGAASVVYSVAGTANSSASQLLYQSAAGIFPLSMVRAYGFANNNGVILGSQSANVQSISRSSAGTYVVTLVSGVVSGTNYGIIANCTQQYLGTSCVVCNYTITSATQFTISTIAPNQGPPNGRAVDVTSFGFIVLQL